MHLLFYKPIKQTHTHMIYMQYIFHNIAKLLPISPLSKFILSICNNVLQFIFSVRNL